MDDDTCILSTTRGGWLHKVKNFADLCVDKGFVINELKTKFMVINGDDLDQEPLVNYTKTSRRVSYTNSYGYLGANFLDNAKSLQALKLIVLVNPNN